MILLGNMTKGSWSRRSSRRIQADRREKLRGCVNSSQVQVSRKQSYWRLFWAAVLLLHAPITINVFSTLWQNGESVRWSSLLLLTLSNLFFIAEIAYAYSLRLLSDRRKVVTFLVVIALLHVGLIERGMPDYLHDAGINYWLLVTTAGLASWPGLRRILDACRGRIRAAALLDILRDLPRRWYAWQALPRCRPSDLLINLLCIPPRAPPAHSH